MDKTFVQIGPRDTCLTSTGNNPPRPSLQRQQKTGERNDDLKKNRKLLTAK